MTIYRKAVPLFLYFLLSLTTLALADEQNLSVSPISTTYHFDKNMNPTPRHLFKNQITWHPQFSMLYTTKYMQYSAFYLSDTYAGNAGGLVLGPKINLFKDYIQLGLVAGVYVKEDQVYNKFPYTWTTHGMEILPIVLGTLSLNIPLTKKIDFSVNTGVSPVLINQSYGLRMRF